LASLNGTENSGSRSVIILKSQNIILVIRKVLVTLPGLKLVESRVVGLKVVEKGEGEKTGLNGKAGIEVPGLFEVASNPTCFKINCNKDQQLNCNKLPRILVLNLDEMVSFEVCFPPRLLEDLGVSLVSELAFEKILDSLYR